ncbi:hypothetical protein [Pendulispora albinea]|uniref:Glycosyltransferase RgtA/B/C/D-like domain-containing protein n=1 Tax=Pendulispora albinea TaxID=2741071 RepID=A0ABZ2LRA0_9BACT
MTDIRLPKRWTPTARNVLHAAAFFVVSFVLFQIWVHRAFQGHYWGPFLPGFRFGFPAREAAAFGMFPVTEYGWDAQFYYYQSNDVFATHDSVPHSDNPAYRYQRIGVPLAAWLISRALGFSLTPPILYHVVQFACFALGFFFLIRYLRAHGVSVLYAYAWALSAGVVNCLAFGMPDPVGDAMFIIAVVACLEGRLLLYVAATIFLVLVREAYVVFAFGVFVLTAMGRVAFGDRPRWLQALVVGLPGAVFLGWRKYVTLQIGISPSDAAMGGSLLDWPLLGPWKSFAKAWKSEQWGEIVTLPLGVVLLAASTWLIVRHRTKSVWYAVIPYVLLLWGLGTTVWDEYSGYMKAFGTPLIAGIMCLAYTKSRWWRGLLLVTAAHGVAFQYWVKNKAFFQEWAPPPPVEAGAQAHEAALKSVAATLSGPAKSEVWDGFHGIFSRWHIGLRDMIVHVRNDGDEPWHPLPRAGLHAMNVSYHWYDESGKTLLLDGLRNPIAREIPAKAEADVKVAVQVPPPGKYVLRFSMLQEGDSWFYLAGGSSYDVAVEVR